MTAKDIARFLAKVDVRGPEDCWNWTASLSEKGYGQFGIRCSVFIASRVSMAIDGRDPLHLQACHRCDNPACVNPKHLFAGTMADNMRDRDAKSRRVAPNGDGHYSRLNPSLLARGERIATAKLTADVIPLIRADCRLQREIANDYGVSVDLVYKIKRRMLWAHVA